MAIDHRARAREGNFAAQPVTYQEHPMLDIFVLALGLGFFAVSIGYAYACERL
jgi:hypothetical protein